MGSSGTNHTEKGTALVTVLLLMMLMMALLGGYYTLTPVNLVPRVNDFQARAFLQDGTVRNSFGGGDDWSALQSVEITLSCRSTVDGRTMTRAMTTRYFPRNVLSR